MNYKEIFGFSGVNRGVSDFLTKEGELYDTQNLSTKKIGILKKTGDYEAYGNQITEIDFTPSVSLSPSISPSISPSLSGTNSVSPSLSPSLSPSVSPSVSLSPSVSPTTSPSVSYSVSPSYSPSVSPSISPNGYEIYSGVEHILSDETREHLIAVNGNGVAKIYKYVNGTWTNQEQYFTKDYKIRMAYFPPLRTTFAVNYANSSVGYDGSSWGSTNLTDAPKAKDIMPFGDRMYMFNCSVSGTSYPQRAYRSSIVDTSITWDTTNDWITFDDEIIGATKLGEHMFVGCRHSAYLFTLNDEKIQISTRGVVGIEAMASYSKMAFYATRDGIYAHDGGDEYKISELIQDYYNAVSESNVSDIVLETKGDYLYVYLGDITVDGEDLDNVILEYDILRNDWNRLSLTTITNLHKFTTSSGEFLFAGDDNGYVWKLFSSEEQNGEEIKSRLITNWIYGGGEQFVDEWCELWGYGKKLSGLNVSYQVDDKDWVSLKQLNGSKDVVKFSASGWRIRFLLEETSKNNMYELYKLIAGYNSRYAEQNDKER